MKRTAIVMKVGMCLVLQYIISYLLKILVYVQGNPYSIHCQSTPLISFFRRFCGPDTKTTRADSGGVIHDALGDLGTRSLGDLSDPRPGLPHKHRYRYTPPCTF